MKLLRLFTLITLLVALSLIAPGHLYSKKNKKNYGNNKAKNDYEQTKYDTNKNPNNHSYSYHGQYKNFNDNNHHNRYFYHDKYYNFHDYYTFYRTESNVFTYEGAYERHGDVFIFSDRYGNEFDLYVKPVSRVSRRFKGYPLQPGDSYNIVVRPTKMYPEPSELRVGINFSFGWGNLSLQNNQYFDMYTAPGLTNIDGRLYID